MSKRTFTAEIKMPHEIHNCPKGAEVILIYPNNKQWGGKFSEVDGDEIVLSPSSGGDGSRMGFSINTLKFWLLKDKL
jgi:hypothetical protein